MAEKTQPEADPVRARHRRLKSVGGKHGTKVGEDADRDYQAKFMAAKRAAARDITIPHAKHAKQRAKALADPEYFLRRYFEKVFYNPFTDDQKDLIGSIKTRALSGGGRQAEAAPRGGGKTSIVTGMSTWGIAGAFIRFCFLLAQNQHRANSLRDDIKDFFDSPEYVLFVEDFPEIVFPVRALEGSHMRCKSQTVDGVRTRIEWAGERLVFPHIKGSAAAGSVIQTSGLDGAIRGIKYGNLRPDFVLLDDPETRESAESLAQRLSREDTIEKDVAGLAGPDKPISIFYLGTIIKRGCLTDKYTDREQKPAWNGFRRRLLKTMPDREDLWNEYIEIRQKAQIEGDQTARKAHDFYLKNRELMDAGAEVSDQFRFVGVILPDGSQLEVSTLEGCFNKISDTSRDAFETEFNNNPPDDDDIEGTGITFETIQKKLNDKPRGIVPADTEILTQFIDVGGRQLHWAVVAWRSGLIGSVIDYGVTPVNSPVIGRLMDPANVRDTQHAVLAALCEIRDWERENGYPVEGSDGVRHIDIGLVDSGWLTDPVYEFCRSSDQTWRPTKGWGTAGKQTRYRPPSRNGNGKRTGHHFFSSRQLAERVNLYNIDSDHWKRFVHEAFIVPAGRPGSLVLPGSDPVAHLSIAGHVMSEIWTREYVTGKGIREYWQRKSKANHWLDCLAGCGAGGAIMGMRVVGDQGSSRKKSYTSWAKK